MRFEHPAAANLIAPLPSTMHIQASSSPHLESMHSVLRLMAAEAGALRPGGEAVITRLADILAIQAIRAWIESDPSAQTGWLGALQDPRIGRAISHVHREPARNWTVASLAHELAMLADRLGYRSEAAFARAFKRVTGVSPGVISRSAVIHRGPAARS